MQKAEIAEAARDLNREQKQRLDEATRAACELFALVQAHGLNPDLTQATRDWGIRHALEDAERERLGL